MTARGNYGSPRSLDRKPPTPPKIIAPPRERVHLKFEHGAQILWFARAPSLMTIHGIASTSRMNNHKYALLAGGCTIRLPCPLFVEHKPGAVGEIIYARKTVDSIYVRATIRDNEAGRMVWRQVQQGVLRAFSGAAAPDSLRLQGHVGDGANVYDRWVLGEVSLVSTPANPDCIAGIFTGSDIIVQRPHPEVLKPEPPKPKPEAPTEWEDMQVVRDAKGRIDHVIRRRIPPPDAP